jgi:hypothetical protein
MRPISADSHVVEGPDVFAGLAERFGDEVPRVVSREGKGDHIVVPARRGRSVNVGIMALAATRLDRPEIGEDRLMWGSDYPHTDSTWPCSRDVLEEMFREHSAGTRQSITRENVARLCGL